MRLRACGGAFIKLIHAEADSAKPPTWQVGASAPRAQRPRITQAAHSKNKLSLFDKSKIAWLGTLVLIEYKPLKIVRRAAPDPAKLDSRRRSRRKRRARGTR